MLYVCSDTGRLQASSNIELTCARKAGRERWAGGTADRRKPAEADNGKRWRRKIQSVDPWLSTVLGGFRAGHCESAAHDMHDASAL
jgi:hypothetical protein